MAGVDEPDPGVSVTFEDIDPDRDGPPERVAEALLARLAASGFAGATSEVDGARITILVPDTIDADGVLQALRNNLEFRPVCVVLPAEPVDLNDPGTEPDEPDPDADDKPLGVRPEPTPTQSPTPGTPPVGGASGCEAIGIDEIEALGLQSTDAAAIVAEEPAILEQRSVDGIVEVRYLVGRVALGASAIGSAEATTPDGSNWFVSLVMKPGEEGIDLFNVAAQACNSRSATCPSGQLAILFGPQVLSAPNVNAPFFERDQIQISGNFSQREAEALARVLNGGIAFDDPPFSVTVFGE